MTIFNYYQKISLNKKILFSIILGVLASLFLPQLSIITGPISSVFVRLLKMLLIPIVFFSIIVGITKLAREKKVLKLSIESILYFFSTTLLSIILGFFISAILKPGLNINTNAIEKDQFIFNPDTSIYFSRIIESIIPENIFVAFVEGNVLSVFFIAILIGVGLLYLEKKSENIKTLFNEFFELTFEVTHWILAFIPVIVFVTIHQSLLNFSKSDLTTTVNYLICVFLALGVHFFIVTPSLLYFFGKYSPITLFKKLFSALAVGLSTASSSATYPITIDCLESKVGVYNRVCSFVLSLGTTINMNGTAIFQITACLFIAQAYNISLSTTQLIIIIFTTLLASIATSGTPSAGIFSLIIILNVAAIPVEGIGLILVLEPIVDRVRTMVNIWANAISTIILGKIEHIPLNATLNKG